MLENPKVQCPAVSTTFGAIKLPDVNKTLTETLGMDVAALSPEASGKFIADQMARWGKVVRENGIKAE